MLVLRIYTGARVKKKGRRLLHEATVCGLGCDESNTGLYRQRLGIGIAADEFCSLLLSGVGIAVGDGNAAVSGDVAGSGATSGSGDL